MKQGGTLRPFSPVGGICENGLRQRHCGMCSSAESREVGKNNAGGVMREGFLEEKRRDLNWAQKQMCWRKQKERVDNPTGENGLRQRGEEGKREFAGVKLPVKKIWQTGQDKGWGGTGGQGPGIPGKVSS